MSVTAACSACMNARPIQQMKASCLPLTQLMSERTGRHAWLGVGNCSCCPPTTARLSRQQLEWPATCREPHSKQLIRDLSCYLLSQNVLPPACPSAVDSCRGRSKVVSTKTTKAWQCTLHMEPQPCPLGRFVPQSCHAYCCRRVQDCQKQSPHPLEGWIWKQWTSDKWAAKRARVCLPLPPTPTSSALP